MRGWSWFAVACLTGCSSILGIGDHFQLTGDGSGSDSGTITDGTRGRDATMIDAGWCVGQPGWEVCAASAPSAPLVLGSQTLDTDTAVNCTTSVAWGSPGQPDACFIAGASIAINGTMIVDGSRPVVLVAASTIMMPSSDGVYVGSETSSGSNVGAGTQPASCPTFVGAPTPSPNGAGGGAGGTMSLAGGDGGEGGGTAMTGGVAAVPIAIPAVLAGGCAGQNGGDNGSLGTGGVGGKGGGAVYLVAGASMTLSGFITAFGAGGHGAGAGAAGGGGGGGGGMIVLDAPAITATSLRINANGGGGGGGAGTTTGGNGQDPQYNNPTIAAIGGNGGGGNGCAGQGSGGDGNAGATAASPGGGGMSLKCSGGGGGGGGGYIRSNVALSGAQVSPAVTVVP